MPYSTIGFEGAALQQAQTVSVNTPEYPGVQVTLGQRVIAENGSEWIYVQLATGASAVAGDLMVVTASATWQVAQLSSTNGKPLFGSRVGVAGATATAGQYIWIQFSGYAPAANVVTGATAFTAMHTGATAGRISATATAGTTAAVTGIVALATAAANTAAVYMTGAAIGAAD